jgi:hypothetical protein
VPIAQSHDEEYSTIIASKQKDTSSISLDREEHEKGFGSMVDKMSATAKHGRRRQQQKFSVKHGFTILSSTQSQSQPSPPTDVNRTSDIPAVEAGNGSRKATENLAEFSMVAMSTSAPTKNREIILNLTTDEINENDTDLIISGGSVSASTSSPSKLVAPEMERHSIEAA